jgi:asparagine synthase (glutamine-hydrolysing)
MCGIVGQLRSTDMPVDRGVLEKMCAALEHRGPDSRGIHIARRVGLGIQRLRVIDLVTGDQPIFNEDGTIGVVLNGELYNFPALRRRLESTGHTFSTRTDTECIVHLYEEEGPDCVRSLAGMFAFALWDGRRQQLVLARDRVGKKPLFYAQHRNGLSFASELNALLQDGDVARLPDIAALDCFLAYGYIPAPHSAFEGVRKLPPASIVIARDSDVSEQRYWRLDYRKDKAWDEQEATEALITSLREAVRRRMISDVPLGAFLSGGIDSSAVVALMAEHSARPIKTFSIGFPSDKLNELPHARRVADVFGTDHHEFVVEPNALEIVPKVVRQYGEPFGDSSAIPTFYLAELARRHVTVALTGDGGDESFGGYQRYVANHLLSKADVLPGVARRALRNAGLRLPATGDRQSRINRVRRLLGAIAADPHGRYASYMRAPSARLYTDDFRGSLRARRPVDVTAEPWHASSAEGLIDRMLEVDVQTYLPGDLLVKMDIATMAYSLEARSPFLDHEFMELAASLPAGMKIQGFQKKVLLRRLLRGLVPREVLDRPKRGFDVPIAEWFKGDLYGFLTDVLLDTSTLARGYFKRDSVTELIDRHRQGKGDHSSMLWRLLVFELWHREVIDGSVHSTNPRETVSVLKYVDSGAGPGQLSAGGN